MSGLIRGKQLVWVRDVRYIDCWRADCQFGLYSAWKDGPKYRWRLRSFEDRLTIHAGESDTLELAQAACQADHDSRAMASVDAVPFAWKQISEAQWYSDLGSSSVYVHLYVDKTWRWQLDDCTGISTAAGVEPTRDAAITAAETFVRQLVMGVPT